MKCVKYILDVIEIKNIKNDSGINILFFLTSVSDILKNILFTANSKKKKIRK